MNEHSRRLLERLLKSCELFEQGKISIEGLLLDIEANEGALEEHDIQQIVEKFISKIEDARFLYSDEQGKNFLLQEIKYFKNIIQNSF